MSPQPKPEPEPEPYVPATSQLVLELFVRSLPASLSFYTTLGFRLLEQRGQFAELGWEGHLLFLDASHSDLDLPPATYHPQANVRVMVPDVDAAWRKAQEMGAKVLTPIQDQYYGLRDFTILDPDGFGVRFGTRLTS
ncbi:Glyoxalase/Bleomycin resistance protein/Dihydroxybiphenyl dioxygenase [Calocera cornea HHB12733]|uniref:Glyoxalase/Bleomycin resistance protein/Dihydroxybiphenyl dioxygenase n=1 Tax=Calocera cornea HHB12733 TaxID=1353952 RepID=A0A165CW68_9BASI|nr:Glyoxalase/Bleomycin resistance protein/Dihydroxybiphenyl dioxygenase [Calocera cornea HHB12733]